MCDQCPDESLNGEHLPLNGEHLEHLPFNGEHQLLNEEHLPLNKKRESAQGMKFWKDFYMVILRSKCTHLGY